MRNEPGRWKKALLASTALAGASLLAAPVSAGTVGSGDNMRVTLSGNYWFQAHTLDETNPAQRSGFGKGYRFSLGNTRFHVRAQNTADNGITYGAEIQWIQTGGSGSGGVDEAWGFVESDEWGQVLLGDTDGPAFKMLVGAFQAHKGLAGPFGGLGGLASQTHGQLGVATQMQLARTDWSPFVGTGGDSTKVQYYTPRIGGLQIGVSLTPNGNVQGRTFTARDDTGFQNVIDYGATWRDTFDDVGVTLGLHGQTGDHKGTSGGSAFKNLNIWGVGGKVDFAGFSLAANYRDNNDTFTTANDVAAGADGGEYWAAALGYQFGPWGVSAWYSEGEKNTTTVRKEKIERRGVGAQHIVAPGWQIRADYNELEHTNRNGTAANNKIRSLFLTNMFRF